MFIHKILPTILITLFILCITGCIDKTDITPTPLPEKSPVLPSVLPKNPGCPAESSWPQRGQNSRHTGSVNYPGPLKGNLKWMVETGGEVYSSPVTGEEGTVYIGSDDKNLYSINPEGKVNWKFKTEGKIRSTPAVTIEENICFLSGDGFLYSLNRDGKLNWKFKTGSAENTTTSSPSIDSKGNIYAVAGEKDKSYLYSVSPGGKENWKAKVKKTAGNTPVIDEDGTVYISDDGIYAYHPDGKLKFSLEKEKYSSPLTTGQNNIIYTGISEEEKSKIRALTEKEIKWTLLLDGYVESNVSIDLEGNIYTGCYDGKLYSLSPQGKINWSYKTKDIIRSAPAIDGEGNVYTGSYDGFLYALDRPGNLMWKFRCNDAIASSPAIGDNETIFFGSLDGNVYAIHSGEPEAEIKRPDEATGKEKFTGNQYGQSPEKNWKSSFAGPSVPNLKWEFRPGDVAGTSPVIYKDKIYVGTSERDKEARVYLLNKDGTVEWVSEEAGKTEITDLVVDNKGFVYFATWNRYIIALDDRGKVKWKFKGSDSFKYPPVITDRGLVYASCGNEVYCLSEKGELEWSVVLEDLACSPPLAGPKKIIYQPTLEGYVFLITEDGKIKKKRELKTELYNANTDSLGNLYLGGNDGIYLSRTDGSTEKFYSFSEGMNIKVAPVINSRGDILIVTHELIENSREKPVMSELHCIDKRGSLIWNLTIEDRVNPPVTDSDDNIYLATEKGDIYVINKNGQVEWQAKSSGSTFNSPCVSADGNVFISYSVLNEENKKITRSGIDKIKGPGKKEKIFIFSEENFGSYPVSDKEGTVYATNNKNLYAINPDGTKKWSATMSSPVKTLPVTDKEGNVYMGGEDGIFRAFTPAGDLLWFYKTKGSINGSPVIDEKGFIYFGSNDGYLYCLDEKGKEEWKFNTGKPVKSSPIISDDTVYINSETGFLYALTGKGKEKWKLNTGKNILYCVSDRNIYIIKNSETVTAFNEKREKLWNFSFDGKVTAAPSFDENRNMLYAGSEEGILYALDSGGTAEWKFQAEGTINSSPLIDRQGNIYFKTSTGRLYAINSKGIKRWLYKTEYSVSSSINLSPDGLLLLSEEGFIYAVGE